MGKKTYEPDSDSDMEDGGAKLTAPTSNVAKSTDAMDVDVPPTPADKKQAAAAARAERAARRKQRREELAAQGGSQVSSIASTPNPDSEPASPTKNSQETKSRRKKTERKTPKKANNTEKTDEKAEEKIDPAADTETPSEPATAPAPAPATDAEPHPVVVDTKPAKTEATNTTSTSVAGDTMSNAPSSVSGVDSQHQGLNRAARRRLMQIENRRLAIKKELGIAVDSDDRQAEVNALLAAWTAQFDEKAEARAAKKAAKKDLSAKGKLLTGHNINDYEKQKQIKKQKRKEALRARQEGS
ncbi:uncharacterized protein ColSpa_09510 [Colletotrichum spaethianum]|uniref:Uncharacterized protein n=1 Tax=Colletotrichum spaethianum TaxID=700344 RepID=A0AA37PBU4_9PEZI|nr:uncharacterized protein ColSpa_09510 [Colletotrichum spaethianum]GKT49329.1 hypothetical protein ColSpa_09510 [Colletotrichum spaethianum]